jgi:hypothetical protein
MDGWVEAMDTGELAPKTINNTLGTLVVCLNDAVEDALIANNPALRVRRLPTRHLEREYLRLHEMPRYLDSCSDIYRPLAELLIGGGPTDLRGARAEDPRPRAGAGRRQDHRVPVAQARLDRLHEVRPVPLRQPGGRGSCCIPAAASPSRDAEMPAAARRGQGCDPSGPAGAARRRPMSAPIARFSALATSSRQPRG